MAWRNTEIQHNFLPIAVFLLSLQSTLGFVALVISTLHTLTYGWSRAFDENQYRFYLPPTFTLTLLVPCAVILAKLFFQLPCMNQRLRRIRNGWEKGRYVKFVLPRAAGEFSSGESTSSVWWMLLFHYRFQRALWKFFFLIYSFSFLKLVSLVSLNVEW